VYVYRHTYIHSLSRALPPSSPPPKKTLSQFHSLSISHTESHTLTHTLSNTRTHSLSFSLARVLSVSLSLPSSPFSLCFPRPLPPSIALFLSLQILDYIPLREITSVDFEMKKRETEIQPVMRSSASLRFVGLFCHINRSLLTLASLLLAE